jgi:hypothetical protein
MSNSLYVLIELKVLHRDPSSLFNKLPNHIMENILVLTGLTTYVNDIIQYQTKFHILYKKMDNLQSTFYENHGDDITYCENDYCDIAGLHATDGCDNCAGQFCEGCYGIHTCE